MKHPSHALPTDAELGILQVLWAGGPQTVRDVYDVLAERRPVGYTTVLKLLQIMHGKRLVSRDESTRSHLYAAAVAEDQVQRLLIADLAQRAFGGSAARLAVRALSAEPARPEEIERIRELLRGADPEEPS